MCGRNASRVRARCCPDPRRVLDGHCTSRHLALSSHAETNGKTTRRQLVLPTGGGGAAHGRPSARPWPGRSPPSRSPRRLRRLRVPPVPRSEAAVGLVARQREAQRCAFVHHRAGVRFDPDDRYADRSPSPRPRPPRCYRRPCPPSAPGTRRPSPPARRARPAGRTAAAAVDGEGWSPRGEGRRSGGDRRAGLLPRPRRSHDFGARRSALGALNVHRTDSVQPLRTREPHRRTSSSHRRGSTTHTPTRQAPDPRAGRPRPIACPRIVALRPLR